MISNELSRIFGEACVLAGARMLNELHVNPNWNEVIPSLLAEFHKGKDSAIIDLMLGRNGWAGHGYFSAAYDLGLQDEIRDLRALRAWERSLDNCEFDKRRGATA